MEEKELEEQLPENPGSENLDLTELLKDIELEAEAVAEDAADATPAAEAPRPRKGRKEENVSLQTSILLYLHDLVYLLAAVIVVFLLCFRVVVVSGTSMNHTLLDGDYLLLLGDMFYRDPKAGDIIVASKQSFDNGKPIVKRVIATAGQTVDIDFDHGIVYVDGVALEEDYINSPTTMKEGIVFPLVVDEGCLFVLGDNRGASKDSRNPEIGLIDKREVLGKVVFLFMPGTNGTNFWGEPNEQRDFDRIGVVE